MVAVRRDPAVFSSNSDKRVAAAVSKRAFGVEIVFEQNDADFAHI